jgi:hypothetical protein
MFQNHDIFLNKSLVDFVLLVPLSNNNFKILYHLIYLMPGMNLWVMIVLDCPIMSHPILRIKSNAHSMCAHDQVATHINNINVYIIPMS